jgi:hypothetical protein
VSLLLALLAAAAAPKPGELKTFRDWTVGCDNGRACQAVGLMPETDAEATTMSIRRGAEPGAAPQLSIDPPEAKAHAVSVGGRLFELEEGPDASLRPRDAAGFIKALLDAGEAALVDRQGKRLAALSPAGASAALLYMDEQQGRLGTVTALARPGSKPATAVPRSPALPVVRQPALSSRPARTLGKARVRQLLGREATVCEYANELSIEGGRLDARHSLVLASHPCGNGAYNFMYSAWIVDEAGRARPATFDPTGGGAADPLANAGWDAKARRLSTFFKGRGLGDCGSGDHFAWDGTRFRLVHAEAMGECRGSIDYITTWRAEVR